MSDHQPFERGFLLHRQGAAVGPVETWGQVVLGGSGWVLRHDPRHAAEFVPLPDGRRWVLVHGLCLYAGDDDRRMSAGRRLAEALQESEAALLDLLDVLGGRYIVVTGDGPDIVVRHDALGMRSVCFSPSAQLVSSHPHLVHDVVAHQKRTRAQGADAVLQIWGCTPYLGIEALLPNHELRVPQWTIRRFYPREPNRFRDMPFEDRLALFRGRWSRQMDELSARPERLVMSLTGGADSRTALALNWEHLQDLSLFTYTAARREGSRHRESLAKDERIVERLRYLIPDSRHTYFRLEDKSLELDPDHAAVVARNSYGSHGAWLLPHYLNRFADAEVIHLRGFGFEVGRAYWDVAEGNSTPASLKQLFMRRTDKFAPSISIEQRRRWFHQGYRRWQYDADLHGMHLRDLYYWEMRMGRWGAEVLNETDIAFETCVALNVRSLLEISLSLPIEDRRSGFLFSELINSSFPLLNFFGKNDDRNLYEIVRDRDRGSRLEVDPGVALTPSMQLLLPGATTSTEMPADGERISIPAQGFRPGAAVTREFEPLPSSGELRFTVSSTYGYRSAADHWRMQVLVDGRLRAGWDGGSSRSPVHIKVTDAPAGAVVSVAAVALRDHRGQDSWSSASRAWIRDVAFDAGEAVGATTVALDAPDATAVDLEGSPPRVRPVDVPGLSRGLFPVDQPTRLDIEVQGHPVPLLVVRREQPGVTPRVLTLFNGAVDLERSGARPIFQRSTWWQDIPCTQIYVADPGAEGRDALSLSWGQISRKSSVIPETAQAVRLLAGLLGAPDPAQRDYFGSSAGGFWAWSAAVLDDGSRAIVNNAQIDWTRWMAGAVNALRHARFDGILPATIRRRYPERTSVLRLWEATGSHPRIDYWVNTASPHDREVDLPQVVDFAEQHPELCAHLRIHEYEDAEAGHNPQSREAALHAILRESEPRS